MLRLSLLSLCLLWLTPLHADTSALLIGNAQYPQGWEPLNEIKKELPQLSRSLRRFLDFDQLKIRYDLDTRPINKALEEFIVGTGGQLGISESEFCYLHFAGHGSISGSQILLLPTDLKYAQEALYTQLDTVPLERIFSMVKEHENVPTLIVLDCCLEGDKEKFKESYLIEHCPKNVCLVAPVSIGETAPAKSLLNRELIRCLEDPTLKTWETVVKKLPNPTLGFSPLIVNPGALTKVSKVAQIEIDPEGGRSFQSFLNNLDPATTPAGTKIHNAIGQQLIFCPAGRCELGSPPDEIDRNPEDEQLLDRMIAIPFLLSAREVTQREWKEVFRTSLIEQASKAFEDDSKYTTLNNQKIREFLKATKSSDLTLKLDPELPMYWINAREAREFCAELTRTEHERGFLPKGWEYGLPTEWEWEYATRSGRFAQFDHTANLSERSWHVGNAFLDYDGIGINRQLIKTDDPKIARGGPHTTGLKLPNAWGLYDCLGNVWELCEREDGDLSPKVLQPRRGGSWLTASKFCRPANRDQIESGFRFFDQGFRICLRKTGAPERR